MRRVNLTVNGAAVTAEVEPRTHLADFLREHCLLTGTHLGCEHGVCGACTLLLDGAPARSCIAFAAACEGADVRTIEGLQDDPVMTALRAAFTAEHALQCGYCTPGMLVTARDIVLRLPDADEARIRLELAGNLCRCTGYAGIVRAIRRVLAEKVALPTSVAPAPAPAPALPALAPLPAGASASATSHPARSAAPVAAAPVGPTLALSIRIARPRAEIWAALHDPALLADCVPGARLLRTGEQGEIEGEMRVALGPIVAVFAGRGSLMLDEAAWAATLIGDAHDARSGTLLSGSATITLTEDSPAATGVAVSVAYSLRGALAQLARPAVVQAVAAEVAASVAANLERRLAGVPTAAASASTPLSGVRLLARVLWQGLRRWLRFA